MGRAPGARHDPEVRSGELLGLNYCDPRRGGKRTKSGSFLPSGRFENSEVIPVAGPGEAGDLWDGFVFLGAGFGPWVHGMVCFIL